MPVDLYPTPNRLRLLGHIADGDVTAIREPDPSMASNTDGWSYWQAGGRNVSARTTELIAAEWATRNEIAPESGLTYVKLTDKGRRIADSPNPAQEAAR